MYRLKDDQLISCYLDALQLKLDIQFQNMLYKELTHRNLHITIDHNFKSFADDLVS